jgi:hypothetical protein
MEVDHAELVCVAPRRARRALALSETAVLFGLELGRTRLVLEHVERLGLRHGHEI